MGGTFPVLANRGLRHSGIVKRLEVFGWEHPDTALVISDYDLTVFKLYFSGDNLTVIVFAYIQDTVFGPAILWFSSL